MSSAKIRFSNFRILRAVLLVTTQKDLGPTIGLSQPDISQIEREKKEISNYLARKIEKSYSLPDGWVDRDNASLKLTAEEFEFIGSLRRLSDEIRERLLNLMDEIGKSGARRNG